MGRNDRIRSSHPTGYTLLRIDAVGELFAISPAERERLVSGELRARIAPRPVDPIELARREGRANAERVCRAAVRSALVAGWSYVEDGIDVIDAALGSGMSLASIEEKIQADGIETLQAELLYARPGGPLSGPGDAA